MSQTFVLDTAHSSIGFAVRHLMISTVRGSFGQFEGGFSVDEDKPASAGVNVKIQSASINTGHPDRDAHLRSPDFLDVNTYPEIIFTSTSVEDLGDSTYRIQGQLTLHGATHPVELQAEASGPVTDPWGNLRVGVVARGKLKRSEWGLSWNQALEGGGLVLSDEVRLEIEAELTAKPAS